MTARTASRYEFPETDFDFDLRRMVPPRIGAVGTAPDPKGMVSDRRYQHGDPKFGSDVDAGAPTRGSEPDQNQ